MTDFLVTNHGSVFTFLPVSDEARRFAEEAFADAMTLGQAYAVEWRYADFIINDLREQGFDVN
jgi:hypothetical protein